jgi:hypothetical protein
MMLADMDVFEELQDLDYGYTQLPTLLYNITRYMAGKPDSSAPEEVDS